MCLEPLSIPLKLWLMYNAQSPKKFVLLVNGGLVDVESSFLRVDKPTRMLREVDKVYYSIRWIFPPVGTNDTLCCFGTLPF